MTIFHVRSLYWLILKTTDYATSGLCVQLFASKASCLLTKMMHFYLQVAWLRIDTQTILTIATHVITKNHRIAVTHSGHRTWSLHIKDTKESDKGWYMCQVNTDPMSSNTGFLEVVGNEQFTLKIVNQILISNHSNSFKTQFSETYAGVYLFKILWTLLDRRLNYWLITFDSLVSYILEDSRDSKLFTAEMYVDAFCI